MLQNESDSIDIIQLPETTCGLGSGNPEICHQDAFPRIRVVGFHDAEGAAAVAVSNIIEIRQHGALMGYFCGLVLKKFVFSMYESLWLGTTVYQGPVVNEDVNQAELVRALMRVSKEAGSPP